MLQEHHGYSISDYFCITLVEILAIGVGISIWQNSQTNPGCTKIPSLLVNIADIAKIYSAFKLNFVEYVLCMLIIYCNDRFLTM